MSDRKAGDNRAPGAPSPLPSGAPSSGGNDEAPGVPGFRTWRGVYVFVFVTFIVAVLALAIFSRLYA
jgi:hypothetical protein